MITHIVTLQEISSDSFKLRSILGIIKSTGGIAAPADKKYNATIEDTKAFLKKYGYNEKGEKIKEGD